jgi:predicted Zn-dependent protease
MTYNQKYCFVHADNGNAKTVAHELGHGVGGLQHTPYDTENIMYNYYSTSKWRLRKNQWDQLNP